MAEVDQESDLILVSFTLFLNYYDRYSGNFMIGIPAITNWGPKVQRSQVQILRFVTVPRPRVTDLGTSKPYRNLREKLVFPSVGITEYYSFQTFNLYLSCLLRHSHDDFNDNHAGNT